MKLNCIPSRQITLLALGLFCIITLIFIGYSASGNISAAHSDNENLLVGRAVLDAATFAPGSTSGQQLGSAPINGQPVPFIDKQRPGILGGSL